MNTELYKRINDTLFLGIKTMMVRGAKQGAAASLIVGPASSGAMSTRYYILPEKIPQGSQVMHTPSTRVVYVSARPDTNDLELMFDPDLNGSATSNEEVDVAAFRNFTMSEDSMLLVTLFTHQYLTTGKIPDGYTKKKG